MKVDLFSWGGEDLTFEDKFPPLTTAQLDNSTTRLLVFDIYVVGSRSLFFIILLYNIYNILYNNIIK